MRLYADHYAHTTIIIYLTLRLSFNLFLASNIKNATQKIYKELKNLISIASKWIAI